MTEPAAVLAWPTLERLAHAKDKRRVDALLHWRDLTQPASFMGTVVEGDADEDFGVEVRPTESAMLRAIGWKVVGRRRWRLTGKMVNIYEPSDTKPELVPEVPPVAQHIKLGELRFHGNELVEWGRMASTKANPAGKPLRPVERPVTGESQQSVRTNAAVWRYLDLPAATPRPRDAHGAEWVACSPEGAGAVAVIDKTPASLEAEALLAEAIANTPVMPPVTHYQAGLVGGRQWVGGRPSCRNDAPAIAVAWDAKANPAREMARTAEESRLRAQLGAVADILDMAVTDATAQAAGLAGGYTESSAAKYGAALIDKALDKLISVAELQHIPVAGNDNEEIQKNMAAQRPFNYAEKMYL